MLRALPATMLLLWAATLAADATVHPTLITAAQSRGGIFEDFVPVTETHGENVTFDVEAFISSDRRLDAGVYRAGKSRFEITEPYGVDEYMHFIEGGVRLTSADGRTIVAGPGDSIVIPKEWTGLWESDGYTKIYVIYSPDEPLTPLNNARRGKPVEETPAGN